MGVRAFCEPPAVEVALDALGKVELVAVGSRHSAQAHIWKALMERYHERGSGPLCGAQLRYLIKSARYGWLGGLAFNSAAWQVRARDQFIGWDAVARRAHLSQVVTNSRFLIVPQVQVKNLASHVLGQCARRLVGDWAERYGEQPLLLETFVERARYHGTCYRAANWQWVGTTCGRGRQDRARTARLARKDIYVYALHGQWRERLCRVPASPTRRPNSDRPAEDWAQEEFGGVALGDARLARRVVSLARDFYARPQAQIPQACTTRAKTKAAYRFFDHRRTTMQALLQPHYEATAQRLAEHPVVLAVQDSSSLNYTAHPATTGLGPLNTSRDNSIGLWMHDTLAFTPEGVPLGLMDVQCWARDPAQMGKRARRHALPIEHKESAKWLKSYAAASQVQRQCPETLVVSVGDREADVYELFAEAAQDASGAKLLVRAERTRRMVKEHGSLWEYMAGQAQAGIQELHVPRRGKRAARTARMAVHYAPVELRPPKRKPHLPTVHLWAVWSHELEAPEGVEALEWMLLTTVKVASFEQACERLRWYATRWLIEVYHRTLKSGCRIKERQLGSAERIEACLAIDLVVAWRIYHLTKLGREVPDVPCTVYFEEAEWKALVAYVTRNPTAPEQPPTLREAMRMVAGLGGFLGRKSDGEPGTKSLWLGLQDLDVATAMWRVMTDAPHLAKPTVSSKHDYG